MQPMEKFYVIGHRGAAGLAPENTLSAFARAWKIGVDAVELDVLLSADGEVVVHHDYRLKPEMTRSATGDWLSGVTGPSIKNLTLAQLKTYDVGRLKPETAYWRQYPQQQPVDRERIPTLIEVITAYKNLSNGTSHLWIEIKTSPEETELCHSPENVTEAVVKALRRNNVSDRARILSFDWRSLAHVREIAPDIPTVYLSCINATMNNIKPGPAGYSPWTAGLNVNDYNGSIPQIVKAAGGCFWAPDCRYLSPKILAEARRLGIKIFVWGPDDRDNMKRLIKMKVDGIITNRPDILKSLVDDRPNC
jgi:glycerophosphoryl diester phosphodiesterase